MLKIARREVSRLKSTLASAAERRRLAPLYSPDPTDLDVDAHISAALAWIRRAQDTGSDRGVSYGVAFGGDFQTSYPETTGYICRTLTELSYAINGSDLLERAIEMGRWEAEIQLPDGSVMGGKLNEQPTPAVFNTGMVILGWNALIRSTHDDRFIQSCARAADWLVSVQEADGNWIRGNSRFALPDATVYNVKAAWGLCEAGYLLDKRSYIDAAIQNAENCLTHQMPNGWFRKCCLSDPEHPLLHTLAYTMQGLVEIGKLTGREEFIDAARKSADAQIQIMRPDGFLAGRQDSSFAPVVNWCCLTGSAQTSVVWSELYLLTNDRRYLDAARLVNQYLMQRHDIQNIDLRLNGGLPGAWPTWGDYGRLMILNWATKYLVDALSHQARIDQTEQ